MFISDISYQKWAEWVQHNYAKAAELAKRHQDEYNHTTSHALTAMTQVADGIVGSLDGADEAQMGMEAYRPLAHANIETAVVILGCATHQRCDKLEISALTTN